MIPKIIHQTWRDHNLPGPKHWAESWKTNNPDWEYRLWTDDDLIAFVQEHHPDLVELYLSYTNPVQRADLARYMILHHCGGIYADIDTECLGNLDVIADDTRVILSSEPVEHQHHAYTLGMTNLLFNGIMASPKGHPFWLHVKDYLLRCQHGKRHVLESTGPLMLTGAYNGFADKDSIAIHSCHLFNPLNEKQIASPSPCYGDYSAHRLANHYWGGSWFSAGKKSLVKKLKRKWRQEKYKRTRGAFLTKADMEARIDQVILHKPISDRDTSITVLIPIRDAAPFLPRCFELLVGLTYPKNRIKLVFCEGDSIDDTSSVLSALITEHGHHFRETVVTSYEVHSPLDRKKRWHPQLQRVRRANLARVRNHLADHGITADDDWALWIDVDVCDYAPDIIERLLAEKAKVVTPDCVQDWEGPSYDMNAFNDDGETPDYAYYKHILEGIHMPPSTYHGRRHLHTFRFLERVPLGSVGGTMLLVHADVHRSGLNFPEVPYGNLLETEGFGRLCRHFGVVPLGLPNVQIRHVRS